MRLKIRLQTYCIKVNKHSIGKLKTSKMLILLLSKRLLKKNILDIKVKLNRGNN